MGTLTASRWDDEYRNQRYANEPPLPFVSRILDTLRAESDTGTGLYVGCGNGRNYLPLVDAGLDLFGLTQEYKFIWFGILHFIAAALLLVRPLVRLGAWNLALGAVALVAGMWLSLAATAAFAHASLESSDPSNGELLETAPDPGGPYGAKGMAETAINPTAAAIANAIANATGKRLRALPFTAERVKQAMA